MEFSTQRADETLNRAAKICLAGDPAQSGELRAALIDFGMIDGLPVELASVALQAAKLLKGPEPDLTRAVEAVGDLQEALSVFSEYAAVEALGSAGPSGAERAEQPAPEELVAEDPAGAVIESEEPSLEEGAPEGEALKEVAPEDSAPEEQPARSASVAAAEFPIERADDALNRAAKLCLTADGVPAGELRVALIDFGMIDGLPVELATVALQAAKRLKGPEPDLARAADAVGELQEALSGFSAAADVEGLAIGAPDSAEQDSEQVASERAATEQRAANAEAFDMSDEGSQAPAAGSSDSRLAAPSAEASATPAAAIAPVVAGLSASRDAALVSEFTAECADHVEAAESALLDLERDPADAELLGAVFRAFHTIKGGAGIFDLVGICGLAHSAETLLDAARSGQLRLEGRAMELAFQGLDGLRRLLLELDAAPQSDPALPEGPALVEAIEAVLDGREAPEVPRPAAAESAPQTESTGEAQRGGAPRRAGAVKVPTDRLDALVDLVGELVITTSMVGQDQTEPGADRGQRSLSQLYKVTTELQQMAMSLRMVPLAATFQKASRTVRDLAKRSDKAVRLELEGQETEIDRNVVEQLSDPLLHMLRNAMDHGLETREERLAAGKPAEGRLVLRAFHQGGRVVIQLADDGRGMDRSKILAKAIERGLLDAAAGERLSDPEVFALVFEPGFSTAAAVTEISGRGVGMDVVRKNVTALRGTIDIDSELGRGTTFTVRLPLTLAIIDGVVVRIGAHRYILPTRSVDTFLRPEADQLYQIQGKGECLSIRGRVLPLHRLHHVLDVPDAETDPTRGLVAILEEEHGAAALLVDELIGQQQVVIKSMGEGLSRSPGIAGAAILGDGTVGLILDGDGIVSLSRETPLIEHQAGSELLSL